MGTDANTRLFPAELYERAGMPKFETLEKMGPLFPIKAPVGGVDNVRGVTGLGTSLEGKIPRSTGILGAAPLHEE